MSATCPGITDDAFLKSVLHFVDCEAQTLGSRGYEALAAPGSSVSIILTGLLTLFIAIVGYRLLLGERLGSRDGVIAFVKIGIVLALATSWAAYRTLVYDVAFHAPAEIVSEVGGAAGMPGAAGGLVDRLEQVDDAIMRLGWLGAGSNLMATRVRNVDGQEIASVEPSSEPVTFFGSSTLGTARLVFLIATIASYASVRLIAGILLALGPLFVGFLLFQGTQSLFAGWIRTLTVATIGAIAVTLLLAAELALLEPWLATLIARREAGLPIGGAATELLVVVFAFSLTMIAALGMAARLTLALRLPTSWRQPIPRFVPAVHGFASASSNTDRLVDRQSQPRSRASAVVEAVTATQQREALLAAGSGAPSRTVAMGVRHAEPPPTQTPLGQGYRRRAQNRTSASAIKRDKNR